MNNFIDWDKVTNVFVAPAGSLNFKELYHKPIKLHSLSTEESKTQWSNDPLTFEVKVKMTDEDRRKFFRRDILPNLRVSRKIKKAIKKQYPGITAEEIRNIALVARIRRIKHSR